MRSCARKFRRRLRLYRGQVDTNPVDQMQIVQNLIDQGVNAIAVSVLDASSIAPVVEAAKAKHIALFTSDSDAPKSGRALYVATGDRRRVWVMRSLTRS